MGSILNNNVAPSGLGFYPFASGDLDLDFDALLENCVSELRQDVKTMPAAPFSTDSGGMVTYTPTQQAFLSAAQRTGMSVAPAGLPCGLQFDQVADRNMPSSTSSREDSAEQLSQQRPTCATRGHYQRNSNKAVAAEKVAVAEIAMLRDKNRKAQAKFRQRQKAKIQESEERIADLQAQLSSLRVEKTALENRNKLLEKIISMRESGSGLGSCLMNESRVYRSSVLERLGPEKTLTLSSQDKPIMLSVDQVHALTFQEYVSYWKAFVNSLAVLLIDANEDPDHPASAKVKQLTEEMMLFMMCWGGKNPKGLQQFKSSRLEGPDYCTMQEPSCQLWRDVFVALNLSPQKCRTMLEIRNCYLRKLGNVLRQRKALSQQLQASIPRGEASSQFAEEYLRAMDVTEQLSANLREEQDLLAELSIEIRQGLGPLKLAACIVQSYPWCPDTLAIFNTMAEDMHAPSPALLMAQGAEEGLTLERQDERQAALASSSGSSSFGGSLGAPGLSGSFKFEPR